MPDVVICEPLRTPVGAFGGVFASMTVTELAATVLTELVRRTGLASGRRSWGSDRYRRSPPHCSVPA